MGRRVSSQQVISEQEGELARLREEATVSAEERQQMKKENDELRALAELLRKELDAERDSKIDLQRKLREALTERERFRTEVEDRIHGMEESVGHLIHQERIANEFEESERQQHGSNQGGARTEEGSSTSQSSKRKKTREEHVNDTIDKVLDASISLGSPTRLGAPKESAAPQYQPQPQPPRVINTEDL